MDINDSLFDPLLETEIDETVLPHDDSCSMTGNCESSTDGQPTVRPHSSQTPSPCSHDKKLDNFLMKGCGCKLNNGISCYNIFDRSHYSNIRDQCDSLSKDELDLIVLGQIMANINSDDDVGPNSPKVYRLKRLSFFHQGRRICRGTFLILHNIGMYYHIIFV